MYQSEPTMHNPAHPGKFIKEFLLDEQGLTVTKVADMLGVSRKTLSKIINGHSGISAEMAIRMSICLGSTPDMWLRIQNAYDLWHAHQKLDTDTIRQLKTKLPAELEHPQAR